VLTEAEEAMIVAFRRHTLLPLDDCLHRQLRAVPNPQTQKSPRFSGGLVKR
jgi:hypothetical protein